MMRLEDDVTVIKGVGTKVADALLQLGIKTVRDLIFYFPIDLEEYKPPVNDFGSAGDEKIALEGTVITGSQNAVKKGKLSVVSCRLRTGPGDIKLTFFNMPYIHKSLYNNRHMVVRGVLRDDGFGPAMVQPVIYTPEAYGQIENRILPVYKGTKGIGSSSLGRFIALALAALDLKEDFLLREELDRLNIPDFGTALLKIHNPETREDFIYARRRFVFQEIFDFLIPVRIGRKPEPFTGKIQSWEAINEIIDVLPYSLTAAQKKAWQQIEEDITGPYCMNRLLQGDVGSGKTIIAYLTLVENCLSGYQGVLMVPTEVLAEQHYANLEFIVNMYPGEVRPVLLTGSLTAAEKRKIYDAVGSGEYNIIIGTHAVIQEGIAYKNLTLCITDEQHRFGVNQRKALADKSSSCHVLVMSATPIPRTLAMILYGDLSQSVIDELPLERKQIKNAVVDTSYRKKAYEFILAQVREGHQIYIVCPMIEAGEMDNLENVQDYAATLREYMPEDVVIGVLHGRCRTLEKNDIMNAFGQGKIHILVSTTVIEVGINVPNATVMMVENADRFGLSTLHQLRGRVGRGDAQSYCIFVSSSKSKQSRKRLEILKSSNDGFKLAEEDLKMRGPGDIFGIRQTGDFDFAITDIYNDSEMIMKTSQFADLLMTESHRQRRDEIMALFKNYNLSHVDFRTI